MRVWAEGVEVMIVTGVNVCVFVTEIEHGPIWVLVSRGDLKHSLGLYEHLTAGGEWCWIQAMVVDQLGLPHVMRLHGRDVVQVSVPSGEWEMECRGFRVYYPAIDTAVRDKPIWAYTPHSSLKEALAELDYVSEDGTDCFIEVRARDDMGFVHDAYLYEATHGCIERYVGAT